MWLLAEFSSSGAVGSRAFVLSRRWLEAAVMPCHWPATCQHGCVLHPSQQRKESAAKAEVSVFGNLIARVTGLAFAMPYG